MARATIVRLGRTYTPAAAGSNETVALWQIKKGWRINNIAFRKLTLSAGGTGATVAFSTDAGAGSGTLSAAKTTGSGSAGDVVNAADGAGMTTNEGGFMATGDGNIQVAYVANAATTAPVIRVGVELVPLADWI